MHKIVAILLAAGSSTRMGSKNKLIMPMANQTIFEATLKKLYRSNVDKIIVVTGHESDQISNLEMNDKVTLIHNTNHDQGLTSSIQSGIKICDDDYDGFIICLADMPFIETKTYNFLIDAFKMQPNFKKIIVPTFINKKGNPILFSAFYKHLILNHKAKEGCKLIVENYSDDVVLMPTNDKGIIIDIDTIEDYNKLTQ